MDRSPPGFGVSAVVVFASGFLITVAMAVVSFTASMSVNRIVFWPYRALGGNLAAWIPVWTLYSALIGGVGVVIGFRWVGSRIGYVPAVFALWIGDLASSFLDYSSWKVGATGVAHPGYGTATVLATSVLGLLLSAFLVNEFAAGPSSLAVPGASAGDLVEAVFRVDGKRDAVRLQRMDALVGDVVVFGHRDWVVESRERPTHPTAVARYVLRPARGR